MTSLTKVEAVTAAAIPNNRNASEDPPCQEPVINSAVGGGGRPLKTSFVTNMSRYFTKKAK